MSVIIERYRERLGEDWPAPLDDLVRDVVTSEETTFIDRTLGRILTALAGTEGLSESVKAAVAVDALAFELSTHHGGVWETYLGPQWSFGKDVNGHPITNPPREAITEEMIEAWRLRRPEVQHPFARARYADAAWDLAPIAGVKRNVEDARAAIDAYLEAEGWPDSNRETAERLSRALALAKSISDANRVARTRTEIVEAARRSPRGAERDHCLLLAFVALVIPGDEDLAKEDEAAIVDAFQQEFDRRVEAGEPHHAKDWGVFLIKFHRSRGDDAAVQEVARKVGGCFETWAGKGNAMLAMSFSQEAHAIYKDAGLRDEMERARRGVADGTARSKSEMATISLKLEIKTDDLEAFADEATKGDLDEARQRLFLHLLVTRDDAEEQLKATENGSAFYQAMSPSIINSSARTSVDMPAVTEDREPHLIREAANLMKNMALFTRFAADRFVTRHELTPDDLSRFGERCGLFPPNRREIRRRAFAAYLGGDYATATHLLVPQVENALRLLLHHLGKSTTTTRDDRTWRQKTLNVLLQQEALVKALGDDLSFYLRVLLSEDLGWNVRDVVCHGLVDDQWFGRDVADRLLHTVIALSLPETRRPKSQDDDDPGRSQASD